MDGWMGGWMDRSDKQMLYREGVYIYIYIYIGASHLAGSKKTSNEDEKREKRFDGWMCRCIDG